MHSISSRLSRRHFWLALALFAALAGVARATPVVWHAPIAVSQFGQLDPTIIPVSTGTGEIRYSNVNQEGYDVVVTTNRLTQTGGTAFGNDYAWYFAGTVPTDSTYATITVRFYLAGTNVPFGVYGADLLLEDCEVYERLGNFSYYDEWGTRVPVLFNDAMFSYSQGPVYFSNYTQVANDVAQQGGTQTGREIEANMTGRVVTGYTFGLHRYNNTAGSMLMMGPGELSEAPIVAWRQLYFGVNMATQSIAGDGANPAGDGIANLLKYAFGLDPTQREDNSSLPQVVLNQTGRLEVTFNRILADTDIAYIVETSSDGINWVQGSTYSSQGEYGVQGQTVQVSSSVNGGVETLVVDDTVPFQAGGFRLLRVRIQRL